MNEIAIIGIGCLFPGANNPEEFWKSLMSGIDVTSELTEEEMGRDLSLYYHPELGTPDKISYTKNGYLRGFSFDPHGYRLPPEKLIALDRIFHCSLYAAKEALKDSGYFHDEELLNKTGLIFGNLSFPTEYSSKLFSSMHLEALEYFVRKLLSHESFHFDNPASELNISLDNAITASLPASFVCSGLGLGGIRYTIDSACASSLNVMELASYHLNTGQADMMLAGAVCCPERLHVIHGFNVLHAFPNQGKSIPFDRSSEGIKTGEGGGIFVLKRLSDAERDGDRIYAVIENIGLSNDGGGKHILSPSKKGQYLALKRAYEHSEPVDYIECHATGTPLGDRTELNSLEEFFADKGKVPMLGANKAHTGHMLTASGMASMIKVIWAMKEGIIPATIGIKDAIASEHKVINSANIIQEHTPWTQTNRPKRAGVNAFGFGGTNAHLILREYIPATTRATPAIVHSKQTEPSVLAIVGMHIHIATIDGIDAFAQALYHHREVMASLPSLRWSGAEETLAEPAPKAAYLEKIDFDCAAFKIPPNETGPLLFDHLFMMKVADVALRDAGFTQEEHFSNTAVIIATEMNLNTHRTITRLDIPWYLQESLKKFNIQLTDVQISKLESSLKDSISSGFYVEGMTGLIGNLVASRISALWNFTGPAFTVSAQENSVYKAIEVARLLLDFGKVDAVLVGAIDQASGWENVEWCRKFCDTPLTFGEGAGAIVLKRVAEAQKAQDRIYAKIESLAIVQSNRNEAQSDGVCQAAINALAEAKVKPEDVEYIELSQNALVVAQNSDEIIGLNKLYSLTQKQVGSVKTNFGNSFVLSGMASIIKMSLCLYHRFLPAASRQQSSQSWELSNQKLKRFAAINGISNDYSFAHLILGEGHDWRLQQKNDRSLPDITPGKRLIKTLLNGTIRMENIILSEDNLQQFKNINLESLMNQTKHSRKVQSSLLNHKELLTKNSMISSANLQNLFLEIQSIFYEDLNHILSTEISLLQETKLLRYSVDILENKALESIPYIPYNPINSDSIVADIESKNLVWNLEKITEIVEGKISHVLGDYYQEMDSYPIRTRTPLPPFMFVSRVTKMTAERGKLEPCTIEWEYDIPSDSFYANNNVLTGLIPFEASHTMLLALAYIGCDMMFEGKLRYRALDSQVEILGEFPQPGDTIRGEVFIHSLIKYKNNLLLQYEYNCYHENKKLIVCQAISGYFSEADLNNSKGLPVFATPKAETILKQHFTPYLACDKIKFSDADIQALQAGDFSLCFGDAYLTKKPFALSSKKLLMISRILQVDPQGGLWGLGQILGELDIDPQHWIFEAHFKNDPVMPGTMLVEGCSQVIFFYMYYLGLHTKFESFKFTYCENLKSNAKFRGEVSKEVNKVQFRITVKKIGDSQDPYVITVAETIHNNKVLGICDNLAVKIVEHHI